MSGRYFDYEWRRKRRMKTDNTSLYHIINQLENGADTVSHAYASTTIVIWILFGGQQFLHCVQTLGFAISEFDSLRPRMYELRASCYMALRNYKVCYHSLSLSLSTSITVFRQVYHI